ncbi:Lrp/AsnC family transcriptional regulator [Vulgatibacter sp.]|uniref:Lrp/AsnC family transcriptional regulator n=1 Tax=Vulgatibacter sp. TaxID=1971226 RepID=UPI003564C624
MAKTDLDRIDCALLAALQKDGRLSNKELAAAVGLAPSSCHERMRRLRAIGVIRGIHAELEPAAVGVGLQALIAVRLKQHSRDLVESFREHVLSLHEVLSLFHVAGADDFLVHVVVRDANHLRDLALDAFTRRDEVAHLQTSLVFEHARAPEMPLYLPEAPLPAVPAPVAAAPRRKRKPAAAAAGKRVRRR